MDGVWESAVEKCLFFKENLLVLKVQKIFTFNFLFKTVPDTSFIRIFQGEMSIMTFTVHNYYEIEIM
jgi:hypothetical protein